MTDQDIDMATDPKKLPQFDDLCNLLLPSGALNSPAELHGMLCGKLCGGARLSQQEWFDTAVDFLDIDNDVLLGDDRKAVVGLYATSLAQLEDDAFGLQLLLPDDDSELGMRTDALGQWCHGFLSGFGSAGIAGDSKMSSDVADALRDLAAIVQIDTDDSEDENEAEQNFVQIAEYVRMAVLTLYMECGVQKGPDAERTTQLH